MKRPLARGVSLLLAGMLAACGGRSARQLDRRSEAARCEEPLTFADPALDGAVRMAGGWSPDHAITRAEGESVRSLYVLGATSLRGLECLPNIESLTAREGPITDIDPLAELEALEWLDLSANAVSDLSPLLGHTELRWVDLTRNAIADLGPLSSNDLLQDIRFDFNQVSSLEPLSSIPIAVLLGTNNAIQDLSPLATMTTFLREVSLSYNPLRDLSPLEANTQLEVLRLDGTEVEDLSTLVKKPLLWRLNVDHTRIGDLSPLSGLPAIRTVHARGNQIDSLEGVTLPRPRCGNALELVDNPLDAADVLALCDTGWVIRFGDSRMPEQCNLDCLN